jgi:serine/threonine protein kinase
MTDYQSGFEIAGYRIESAIGRGGMAVVYRAEDTRLGRKVALKVLTPVLAHNEQFQQRFIRESRLAASLDHPNIVPIYEAGEADGQLFIAMRYVAGSDLKVVLGQEGGLPLARMLRIFVQIGDALDAAHELGLVHRDVKPGNILVTSGQEHSGHGYSDHVYLTDFGLTKRTSSLSGALTGTGHFLGTVDYVSPEQIQGAPVGPSTDVYALGCVLYECLTGQLPFHRDDDAALLWAHLVEAPPPVSGVRPDLPAAVDDVVAKAMAKAPEDRYASCHELMRDLELALDVAVQLPGATRTGRRAGASRNPLAEDASAGPDPGIAPDLDGTSGRASHPSFPPGVIEPMPAGATVPPDPDRDESPEPAFASQEDQRGSAAPEAAWDGSDQGYWDDGASADEPVRATARRRRWLLIAVAAATCGVLAVAAALFLFPSRSAEAFRTYDSPGTVIPYRLSRPQSWTPQTGTASDTIVTPRPDAVGPTFLQGSPDRWTGTRRLLATSPADAVGVYVSSQFTALDTSSAKALEGSVSSILNARPAFSPTHLQLTVAGSPADELEGVLADPADPRTRLRIVVDAIQPRNGGSMVLVFFAPPDEFDGQRPVFTKVRDGLTFTG